MRGHWGNQFTRTLPIVSLFISLMHLYSFLQHRMAKPKVENGFIYHSTCNSDQALPRKWIILPEMYEVKTCYSSKYFTSTSRFFRETPITKALGGLLEKYKHYRKFACESKNEMKHVLQTQRVKHITYITQLHVKFKHFFLPWSFRPWAHKHTLKYRYMCIYWGSNPM
jgi:hypothetical protein